MKHLLSTLICFSFAMAGGACGGDAGADDPAPTPAGAGAAAGAAGSAGSGAGAGTGGTAGAAGGGASPPVEHPNFIFLLGEARGWTSTSTLEDDTVPTSKSDMFETPNLDTIAADGATFADFYAPSPRCMPSRASYFTGKSPAALHMTFIPEGNKDGTPKGNVVPPFTETNLPTSNATVASVLKAVGYATAHYGKWHAGQTDPSAYGFDESDGPTTNRGPSGEDNPNPAQAFATADRGMSFMAKHTAAGKPFYLQISHYGGGDPIDSTPESYEAESKRLAGKNPNDIADAAVIRDMDKTVGMILQKVQELGIADRTYIIFSADHGRAGASANLPLNQGKGSVWEGGIRVPLFIRGPGINKGTHSHVRASQVDLLPTLVELAHVPGPLPPGLEGGSLWPLLSSSETKPVQRSRDELVVHFPHYDKDPLGPASAILLGNYKLIRFYEDGSQRLFDLDQDLQEKNDLAAKMPEKVAELAKRMDDYLKAVGAQIPGHL